MTLASIAAKSSGSQELALAKSAKTMCSLKRSSYQAGAFVLLVMDSAKAPRVSPLLFGQNIAPMDDGLRRHHLPFILCGKNSSFGSNVPRIILELAPSKSPEAVNDLRGELAGPTGLFLVGRAISDVEVAVR